MTASAPPGPPGTMTPAEREARWKLCVQFAIEAASEDEARAALSQALARMVLSPPPAGLAPGLPLRGEPLIRPRDRRILDDIWIAEVEPDLTQFQVIESDDANTRCVLVLGYFPMLRWAVPLRTEREARYEWPTDIWDRPPDRDDPSLHPAVRAVKVFCEAKQV